MVNNKERFLNDLLYGLGIGLVAQKFSCHLLGSVCSDNSVNKLPLTAG